MSDTVSALDLSRVAVIIPALNEAESLDILLPMLASMNLGQILVCDNGSTDGTGDVATAHGAACVRADRRGYGAACFAGMQHLDRLLENVAAAPCGGRPEWTEPRVAAATGGGRAGLDIAPMHSLRPLVQQPVKNGIDVVVFLDADLSDDPAMLPRLVEPILANQCDFVVGSRVKALREPGSMSVPQAFANRLFPLLMRLGWGHRYRDMGPFRAVRRSSLEAMGMRDRAFGWTIEMQIRAVELGLRIEEVPVPCRRRARGSSKVSGTVGGVLRAAYWITRTCAALWLTKSRRARARA